MSGVDPGLLQRVRERLASDSGVDGGPAAVADAVRAESAGVVGDTDMLEILRELETELTGAGVLSPLLADPRVSDVLVNGPSQVWVDRGAGLRRAEVGFADEAAVRRLAQRLALAAAVAVSQLEGRREGEAQLRDVFALRRPGDDPGPGGRVLIGWRALGEARALRSTDWPVRLPGFFDLSPGPGAEILRDLGARFVGRALPLRFAAEAAREVLVLGPAYRGLALWLADALWMPERTTST